jgi:hypothetical protein
MPHPLVLQLRFTRAEFARALQGLDDDDARRRLLPMNCIAWNIGHLAWQEQRYFIIFGQGRLLRPDINELFAYGAPASVPPLAEALAAWREITAAADPWLDAVTTAKLQEQPIVRGEARPELFGSLLQRVIYHYWYHTGENAAIRQSLGHVNLPEFVGDIDGEAPYRPE